MRERTTTTAERMALLAAHRLVGSVPENERQWLAEHGVVRDYDVGDVVNPKGNQATELSIAFSGHLVIRFDRGAGAHKIFEWRGGEISGLLPYSRGSSPPSDVVAEEPSVLLFIAREEFPALIRHCPVFAATCVHVMVDRARRFTSAELADEKLISMGKLAAGLAHELNNPASAVVRGAKLLSESIDASEAAARTLGAAGLSTAQLATIDELREMCLKAAPTALRSTLGRSEREDEFETWLEEHDADARCASVFAETGVTIESVDALAAAVAPDVLNATLKWMAAGCSVRALAAEIEIAATRINDLVHAVKGFTYMDHARTPEPVDIRQGIADTLTMLGAKSRAKGIGVVLALPDDLPSAFAVGAELNQVWMNLIDNAFDAVAPNGQVSVTAARQMGRVVVRVTDDGPGIPVEILGRIFDPFFTTKGVGKGTGLGLDIVRRLLQRHDAEISVESAPGRTEFQVRLPIHE